MGPFLVAQDGFCSVLLPNKPSLSSCQNYLILDSLIPLLSRSLKVISFAEQLTRRELPPFLVL